MTEKARTMAKHSGMGAIPHAKGVTFRVWAPHAGKAYVIDFPRAGLWKTRFNSDSYNYGPNFANHPTTDVETRAEGADGLPCSGEIGIGPYTVVIFSQDEQECV